MTSTPHPFFEDLIRGLDEDGYCIWRGLFNLRAIDDHLAAYESEAQKIDGHFRKDKSPATLPAHREARKDFYDADKTYEALCFEPQLLDFLRLRFSDEPVLRMVGTHLYSLGSHLHTDCLNTAATDPWEHELRIWAALEDIDPTSGPVFLYPRSHRLITEKIREEILADQPWCHEWLIHDGKPYTEKAKAFAKITDDKARDAIMRHKLEPIVPQLAKGDALIFNPAIFHGTMKSEDQTLTRKAMIFNFYAKETPFYRPGAYWGSSHDYRRPENEVRFQTDLGPSGWKVIDYLKTYEEISRRKIIID